MNGSTPGTQDAGADPGTQRPRDDGRATGLLVLPGDGGQQAAGDQAGGVQGADAGGWLALSGAVADAGAAGLVVTGPGRGADFLVDPIDGSRTSMSQVRRMLALASRVASSVAW
jgi:hypothetical protein